MVAACGFLLPNALAGSGEAWLAVAISTKEWGLSVSGQILLVSLPGRGARLSKAPTLILPRTKVRAEGAHRRLRVLGTGLFPSEYL